MLLWIKYAVLVTFQLVTISSSQNVNFSISNFTSAIASNEISAIGNFNISQNGTSLDMTTNGSGATTPFFVSRVLHRSPVTFLNITSSSSAMATSFNTSFVFSYAGINNTDQAGDGFSFIICPPTNFAMPANTKDIGGGLLGLYDIHSQDQIPFVAVEFDSYQNTEYFDPDDHHLGIDINSSISIFSQSLSSKILLKSTNASRRLVTWIDYDAALSVLDVYLAVAPSDKASAERIISYPNFQIWKHILNISSVGFTAATGLLGEIHSIHSWNFSSSTVPVPLHNDEIVLGSPKKKLHIGVVITVVLVCFALTGVLMLLYRRKCLSAGLSLQVDFEAGPRKFSYKQLRKATGDFKNVIGQGGSGIVYKGLITVGDSVEYHVAVKKIFKYTKYGEREFKSEVHTVGRLRHKNLVQLYGWCIEKENRFLVYQYMSNRSLDKHLFPDPETDAMNWPLRLHVLRGVASALVYLHTECERVIIHRDIKSGNIMLDSEFNGRLGDFGLAKYLDHGKYCYESSITGVVGTWGYVAPEYAMSGRATTESDMYSFGMQALETACGRRPFDDEYENLLDYVWRMYLEGDITGAADNRLHGRFNVDEMKCMLHVGLLCTYPDPKSRLTAADACRMLREVVVPELPASRPVAVYVQIPTNILHGSGIVTSSDLTVASSVQLSSGR